MARPPECCAPAVLVVAAAAARGAEAVERVGGSGGAHEARDELLLRGAIAEDAGAVDYARGGDGDGRVAGGELAAAIGELDQKGDVLPKARPQSFLTALQYLVGQIDG